MPAVQEPISGDVASDSSFLYHYDPENRLMTAAKTGTAVTYAYDPLGHRTKKVVIGGSFAGTTYFLDDGDDEIAEYDGSGSLLRRYVQGPAADQPIAMLTAAGVKTFFHQDKIGNVIAMSNVSGTMTGAGAEGPYTYDEYGTCYAGSNPCGVGVPYRFTGRRLDPETGLYYYRARYYSAALGRFLQTDPIGYKDDINWYAYVGNDPTNRTDPTGLDAVFGDDRASANGFGHIPLFFQDSSGQWYRYDQFPAGGTASGGEGLKLGQSTQAGVTIIKVNPEQVPANGIRIQSTQAQDAKIAKSANASKDRFNSGKEKYNLYVDNCKNAAVAVVNDSGSGIVVKDSVDPRPNHWFDSTKNDPTAIQDHSKDPPPPPPSNNCIASGKCSPY